MQCVNTEHSSICLSNLNCFRKWNQLCDVVLKVSDISIPAHKNVLSSSSAYFRAMFTGSFPESSQTEVILKDLNANTVNILVNYMYTSHIEINADNVHSLLSTSCYLQIGWVQNKCCEFLALGITPANCLSIMEFADENNCKKLKEFSEIFAVRNFHLVSNENLFLEIDISELQRLLSHPQIYNSPGDNKLFRGIMRWTEYDPDDRSQYLNNLLMAVHPALVTKDLVKNSTILMNSETCSEWVSKSLNTESEVNIFLIDTSSRSCDFQRYQLKNKAQVQLSQFPSEVFAFTPVGYKHLVFTQGGRDEVRISAPECFYYNIYRGEWKSITPLMRSRWGHRSCVINDSIYAIGGYNEFLGPLESVERFDLTTGKCHFVDDMLDRRLCMGGVVYENCLYVMGGENHEEGCTQKAERYDPRVGHWESIAEMNDSSSFCSSAIVSDRIYCGEGYGNTIERYDFKANRWELIEFDPMVTYDMFSINNDLYSISGPGLFKYSFSNNEWTQLLEYETRGAYDMGILMEMVNL